MSQPAEYFDSLYAHDPDPWKFASSPYEQAKYQATLAALPRDRFSVGLEIGCSIGVFTRRLAERCDRLLALDLSATALELARARCADLPTGHVSFERRAVPEQWPAGHFDLIALSEVLYFLDPAAVRGVACCAAASLAGAGCILLVNWLGDTGTELSGEAAAELFLASLPRRFEVRTERSPGYRLDRLLA